MTGLCMHVRRPIFLRDKLSVTVSVSSPCTPLSRQVGKGNLPRSCLIVQFLHQAALDEYVQCSFEQQHHKKLQLEWLDLQKHQFRRELERQDLAAMGESVDVLAEWNKETKLGSVASSE